MVKTKTGYACEKTDRACFSDFYSGKPQTETRRVLSGLDLTVDLQQPCRGASEITASDAVRGSDGSATLYHMMYRVQWLGQN